MTYQVFKDRKGEWRWRLRAKNGRIVADSGEGYKSWRGCYNATWRFEKACADANIVVSQVWPPRRKGAK